MAEEKTKSKKKHRQLAESLDQCRREHEIILEKLERTRLKFRERSEQLHALEKRMAELERLNYAPESRRLGQSAAGAHVRRARLIFNPRGGTASRNPNQLEEIVGCLREHGIVAEINLKTSGKAVRELAKEAVAHGDELVIVAGGDGTIAEVAVQLANSQTTLGVLPVGTMNNLARSWGVPLNLNDACALLGIGATRKIDVGRVFTDVDPTPRYFLETGGVGLSAIALPAGQAAEKHQWSQLPQAMHQLFGFHLGPMQVELSDGQSFEVHAQVVTVSNGPLMGKNILIAPDAKVDDDLLDIAVYENMNKKDLLGHFMAAMNGGTVEHSKVQFFRAKRTVIRAQQPVYGHADKDMLAGATTFTFEAVHRALSIVAGQGIALSVPNVNVPSVPPLAGPQHPSAEQFAPETPSVVVEVDVHTGKRKKKHKRKKDQ